MFNPNDLSSYASSSQTNPHLQYSHPSSSSTSSHQAQHPTSPSFLNQPPPSSSHALTPPAPQPQQQQLPSISPSGSTGKTVKGKGKMKVKEEREGGRLDTGSQPTKKRKRGRMATACVACNTRKQKCDGGLPCLNCTKRGVQDACVFPPSVVESAQYGPPPAKSKPKPPPPTISSIPQPLPTPRAPPLPPSSSIQPLPIPPPPPSAPVSALPLVSRPPLDQYAQPKPQQQEQPRPVAGPSKSPSTFSTTGNRVWPSSAKEAPPEAPAYFGGSYFGPAAALRIIAGGANVDDAGGSSAAPVPAHRQFRTELSHSNQVSQLREFVALLPRRSICDTLVEAFFEKYDSHLDLVYRDEFQTKYDAFWNRSFDVEDISGIDMRWLALLFIVLAYGCLLGWTEDEGAEGIRDRDEGAKTWYWAARRAIMSSPTFHGESLDIVRATILVTFYLVNQRRAPEAWLLISYAARFAQAQGLHIDGSRWNLSLREAEIRRRLWAQLYCLDRSISLFLGRPLSIQNDQSMVVAPANIHDSELDAPPSPARPLSSPTKSTFLILHKSLSSIIGSMQNLCFGIQPTSFRHVLQSDAAMVSWSQDLPPHFRFDEPDTSLDVQLPWLVSQRISLHSKFHLSRLSLHRPFLLRAIVAEEFSASRDACVASAFGDMSLRLQMSDAHPITRFHWMVVSGGFNAASIMGIVLIRDPWGPLSERILRELKQYLAIQRDTVRREHFLDAEIRVIEMCLLKAERARADILERQQQHRGVVVEDEEYYSVDGSSEEGSEEQQQEQDDGSYASHHPEGGGLPNGIGSGVGIVSTNGTRPPTPLPFPPPPRAVLDTAYSYAIPGYSDPRPQPQQSHSSIPSPLLARDPSSSSSVQQSFAHPSQQHQNEINTIPFPDKPSPTLAAYPPLDSQPSSSWSQPLVPSTSSQYQGLVPGGDPFGGSAPGGEEEGDLFSMSFPEDPNDWQNWETLLERLAGVVPLPPQSGGWFGENI
ncbi:fungal-specific transcription factor domain-containing protein [Mrakia frigida]|uniref:transcription factor domain-containing protein n=1 Tax=Mrakia frigida TaxID=29902 RepID=UPI003FCC1060